MPSKAVIDSGPLVALFDRDDLWHERVCDFLRSYQGKLYTTIAVITEVSHLLDFHLGVQQDFLQWVAHGAVTIENLHGDDLQEICVLCQQYLNVPMDFADASLVHIAEKKQIQHVISIDSDFYIYRTLSNGYLINLIER